MFTEKQATLCQKTIYNVIQVFFVDQFKADLTAKKKKKGSRSCIMIGMMSVYCSLQHSSWKISQR